MKNSISYQDQDETLAAVDMDIRASITEVEKLIRYSFGDKTLLQEALTHASYTGSPSYQRLEFVGDAALGLAVAEFVFNAYPGLSPGQLSLIRAANVSGEKLARVAIHHELYRYVRHKERSFDKRFDEFVLAVQKEDGGETYGGLVKAPKVLADIVESVAAAVYIDCKYDREKLWKVFKRLLEPISTLQTIKQHPQPVAFLHEFYQKEGKKVKIEVKPNKVANVYVDGKLFVSCPSTMGKKAAGRNAAKAALEKLSGSMPSSNTVTEKGHGVVNKAVEIEWAKRKLNELCSKEGWCQPQYRVQKEFGPDHDKRFICSVKVKTANGTTFFTEGDMKPRIKKAESSSASMMLHKLLDPK